MPPEFRKKYFPKVTGSELEAFQRGPFGDAALRRHEAEVPTPSPRIEAPRALRAVYQELLPHNLDPRYRDRLRERLERREMMLRRRHLKIPEFYVVEALGFLRSCAAGNRDRYRLCVRALFRCRHDVPRGHF
ncbi:unnamed protein product, partial [Dibothriocephalus latus]